MGLSSIDQNIYIFLLVFIILSKNESKNGSI